MLALFLAHTDLAMNDFTSAQPQSTQLLNNKMGLPIFVSPRKGVPTEPINHAIARVQREHPDVHTEWSNVRGEGGERNMERSGSSLTWPPGLETQETGSADRNNRQVAEARRTRLGLQRLRESTQDHQEEPRTGARRSRRDRSEIRSNEDPLSEGATSSSSLAGTDIEELREMLQVARRHVRTWQRRFTIVAGTGADSMAIEELLDTYRRQVLRIEEIFSLLNEPVDEGDGIIPPDLFRLLPLSAGLEDLTAARADLERSRRGVGAMRRLLAGAEGGPSELYLEVIFTVSMVHTTRVHFDWLRRRLIAIRNRQYFREHSEATESNSTPE